MKTSKPPAFQFYVRDWRSSQTVLDMKPSERGLYIDMLALAWDSEVPGFVPSDPVEIAKRLTGYNRRSISKFLQKFPQTFVKVSSKFRETFANLPINIHETLCNEKLFEMWLKYSSISNERAKAALERWHAIALQEHSSSFASSIASPKEVLNPLTPFAFSDENIPGPEPKPEPKPKKTEPIELPIWVPLDPFMAFLEMRKKLRKPMTDHAMKLLINRLGKLMSSGQDLAEVLNQSTLNGWQNVFEVKTNGNGAKYANKSEQRTANNIAAAQEALRRAAERDRQAADRASGGNGGNPDLKPN